MKGKYLHKTVKTGLKPKELTLLLTKCFGEEYNKISKHDCFNCQVSRRCRYVHNKGLKKTLLKRYKKQIKEKLEEKEKAEKRPKKRIAEDQKKELIQGINLSEKILKKQLKQPKKKKFKADKREIIKEIKELEKTKKILKKFFKD